MAVVTNNKPSRNFFSFLSREPEWREINGYEVGDVQSDQPVMITAGSTLVGNIFAPKIAVAGLLYGSTAARETRILEDGKIWGDVFTARLHIEPGGKIQGWVSSLDEKGYLSLKANGVIPRDTQSPVTGPFELPAETFQGEPILRSENQIDILRRLQIEAATALSARAELEQTFEKRLSEVAGETAAKAVSLHEELNSTRSELTAVRQQRDEGLDTLRARNAQIERQLNELVMARDLLNERNQQIDELNQLLDDKIRALEAMTNAKNDLDTALLEANQQIDQLNGRIRSIETALQSSLQHSAEQEDSLVRWQELAEVTETKAKELEGKVDSLQNQIAENGRMIELLRSQKRQAEEAWESLNNELQTIRRKETKPLVPSKALAESEEMIARLKVQSAEWEVRTKKAVDRVALLEKALEEEEKRAQHYQEQVLWDEANLQTAQNALEEAQKELETLKAELAAQKPQLAEQTNLQAQIRQLQGVVEEKEKALQAAQALAQAQTAELARLQTELEARATAAAEAQSQFTAQTAQLTQLQADFAKKQAFVERCKAEIQRLNGKMGDQQKKLDEGLAELDRVSQQAQQIAADRTNLKKTLRETNLQLEAHEKEIETYVKQVDSQGQNLAEMRALLIEKEVQMAQAQANIEKQNQFIKKMQQVTTERVQALQGELGQARQQIKDLTAVLERRQKR